MKLYTLKPGFKLARKKAGFKQEELAKKLDVHTKTIMNWEQGIANPPLETVIKIADLLRCDIDFLCGRIECKNHDHQYIRDEIGLSERSIEILHKWETDTRSPGFTFGYLEMLNKLLSMPDFGYLLNYLAEYEKNVGSHNELLADFHNRKTKAKPIDGKSLYNYTSEDDMKDGKRKELEKEVQYNRIMINDYISNIISTLGTIEK